MPLPLWVYVAPYRRPSVPMSTAGGRAGSTAGSREGPVSGSLARARGFFCRSRAGTRRRPYVP